MRIVIFFITAFAFLFPLFCQDIAGEQIKGEPCSFEEVWGYVTQGDEKEFDIKSPVTDVCYFAAAINTYGELSSAPNRKKISAKYKGRVHLVTACDGRALSHFIMEPSLPLREKLIKDLVSAAKDFDGLQIDYEYIPARDAKNFITFLQEVRRLLPEKKIFSVAVPARMRTIWDDIYNYPKIAAIADRVFIMAYDEHWSTSAPGSIASINWCKKIASYASSVIPKEKLVVGLPSYGRTWGQNWNRAFYHSGIKRIWRENGRPKITRTDSIPHFSFTFPLSVTCYYEDDFSLVERCRMYERMGILKIGFWKCGFEEPSFWKWIKISKAHRPFAMPKIEIPLEKDKDFDFLSALRFIK